MLLPAVTAAIVTSEASNHVIQSQPLPNHCHVRGHFPFNSSDLHCTPGALNPAVTQASIGRTICRVGYTRAVRPSESITAPEKRASMRAYGLHRAPGSYEYDHLISLELGGATNAARNLWPEPGDSPNLKDKVENRLHSEVCHGRMSLARAQRIISLGWVSYYKTVIDKPPPPPPPSPPPSQPSGATGKCNDGTLTYAVHHQGACSYHGGVAFWF
jgi:hypothetical protein